MGPSAESYQPLLEEPAFLNINPLMDPFRRFPIRVPQIGDYNGMTYALEKLFYVQKVRDSCTKINRGNNPTGGTLIFPPTLLSFLCCHSCIKF